MIPLTVAEVRRLFNLHATIARSAGYHERWSLWRRRHQAHARRLHYQRRLTLSNRLIL